MRFASRISFKTGCESKNRCDILCVHYIYFCTDTRKKKKERKKEKRENEKGLAIGFQLLCLGVCENTNRFFTAVFLQANRRQTFFSSTRKRIRNMCDCDYECKWARVHPPAYVHSSCIHMFQHHMSLLSLMIAYVLYIYIYIYMNMYIYMHIYIYMVICGVCISEADVEIAIHVFWYIW